jgi:nicotinamide mononucleotide transporter
MFLSTWFTQHGLEFVAVVFGIISVLLSVRQNIWSWPTALVNVALFFALFYKSGLYSDMGLQVVYFVLSLYGWYEWLYGGKGHTELRVSRTSVRTGAVLAAIALVGWTALSRITARLPGVALPSLDAALTTASLIAQWMMTRKLLENWALWVVLDVVYVGMFIFKGLYLTAANYAVYLVLAVLGHVAWKRSLMATA